MITIDQRTFERVVSSATNCDNNVFDKISTHLAWVEEQLVTELISPVVISKLENYPNLLPVIVRLICLRTYYEQIPQLDLILTPTGFGIVSNNNLAPASVDRVQALRKQVKQAYDDDYDRAIEMLIGTEWADTTQARICIVNIIYTAKLLRLYTNKPDAHRSDLEACHVVIYKAEELVRERISAEFYDSLLDKIRHDDLTKIDTTIIDMISRCIGFTVERDFSSARKLLTRIEDFADTNADSFPVYKNSAAYKVKHFEYYQNEKEDTTFFWG